MTLWWGVPSGRTLHYFEKDTEGDGYTEKTGADNPLNGIDEGRYSCPTFADLNGDGRLDFLASATYKHLFTTKRMPPA